MEYIPDEDQEPDWYKKYLDIKKKNIFKFVYGMFRSKELYQGCRLL